MIWTYVPGPGGNCFGGLCQSRGEFDRVRSHLRHRLDGQWASVDEADPETLRIRFSLDEPWRPPPTRITFEDPADAERISAFGLHVFEGALYRAILEPPATVMLDRLFTSNPPFQWSGDSWPSEIADKVAI